MANALEYKIQALKQFFDTIEKRSVTAVQAINQINTAFSEVLSSRTLSMGLQEYSKNLELIIRNSNTASYSISELINKAEQAWAAAQRITKPGRRLAFSEGLSELRQANFSETLQQQFNSVDAIQRKMQDFSSSISRTISESFVVNGRESSEALSKLLRGLELLGSKGIDPTLEYWFKNLFKTLVEGSNFSAEGFSKLLTIIKEFSSSTGYLRGLEGEIRNLGSSQLLDPISQRLNSVFPNFLANINLEQSPLALLKKFMEVEPSRRTSPFLLLAQQDIDLAKKYYDIIVEITKIYSELTGRTQEAAEVLERYNSLVNASVDYVKSGRGQQVPLQNFLNQMEPFKGQLYDVKLKQEFSELLSEQDTQKIEERISRLVQKMRELAITPRQLALSFSDVIREAGDLERTQRVFDKISDRFAREGGIIPVNLRELFSGFIGEENAIRAVDNINKKIKEFGFTLSDLKGVTREASTGITRLTFGAEQELVAGVSAVNNLTLTLSKSGEILSDTQKRFRDFFSAVTRDIGEVVKWGIAVAVIYGPFRKMQELISEMVVNQAKLAEIQIVTGQSNQEVAKSFDAILKVAAKTGESVNNVAEAYKMAYIAAGGVRDENLRNAVATELLADSLALARLSSLSAEESLDILSATLKQLGMELYDGSTLLDKWVAVSKQANVDLQTLATSFSIISSAGENAGLSVDQMNGIIAATAEVSNLSAREVGNMIRAFISGYQTDTAVRQLERYGIAVKDVNGNIRGFMEVFTELKRLVNAGVISEPQLARISEILGGGARRGAQVAAFIKNLEVIDQIAEVSRTAEKGLAEQALEVRLATVDATANKLRLSFSKLAQSIGTKGGLLDFIVSLNEALIGLTNALSSVVSLLGSSTLPLTFAAVASMFLGGNRGLNFNFRNILGTAGYGIGSFLGKAGYKLFGVGGGEAFPYVSPLTGQQFGKFQAPQREVTLESIVSGSPEIPIRIVGIDAAGDRLGGRFATFLQKNSQWLLPGAVVFSRIFSDLINKDFQKAAAGAAGAFIGALGGGRVLSSIFGSFAGPVGMMLGYAIVEGIINASRSNFDLQKVFAENIIKGQEIQKPEQKAETELDKLKKEADRLREELIKSASPRISALGGISNLIYGERGAQETFNFAARVQYNIFKAFKRFNPEEIDESKYAFGLLMTFGDEEIKQRYIELSEKIAKYESELSGNFGAFINRRVQQIVDNYSNVIEDLIREQKAQLFEATGVDITPTTFREKIDALSSIGVKTANYYAVIGKEFEKVAGIVGDSDKAFRQLAEILLKLSPQESEVLSRYIGSINTLTESYGEGSEEVKQYKEELASLLVVLYRNQQLQDFKMPTVMSETFTEREANLIAERARQMTEEFYRDMLPDDTLIPAFLAQLTPIAVRVSREAGEEAGEEFWKKFTDIGPGMFDKAKKELQDLGLIGAKDLRIEPMLDMTKANFDAVVRPLISKFENILIQAFYGSRENLPTETIGIVFKDGTDKINVNLLALRMALDKTNELLQKQLDGIFNLPEGAELWVPAQAAELALQTLQGMQGKGAGDLIIPDNMNEVESQFGLLADAANEASLALQAISTIMDTAFKEKLDADLKAKNLQTEGKDWLRRQFGELPGPQPPRNLQGVAAVREADRLLVDDNDDLLRRIRNKILREQFMRKELIPSDTAKPIPDDVMYKIANLLPAISGLITVLRVLAGQFNINWNFKQPKTDITPRSSLFIPTANTQPVSKVDLTVNTTNQVVLDGRIIALALKRYLARDLRIAAGGRSVSNNFFV